MFTVNIKGQRDPRNIDLVKLDLIFYKRGYARVSKVIHITGLYREWDSKSQSFTGADTSEKNKLLRHERLKYLKVAEKWEYQGKDWIPVELSHYYDDDPRIRNRYITVAEMLDALTEKTATRERYKNGLILTSEPTAKKYRYLKNSLERFVRSKYRRDFSKYRFRDITEQFLLDYTLWTQLCGGKQGNEGGIRDKLRKLRAVCLYAKENGVYNVNLNAFRPPCARNSNRGWSRPKEYRPRSSASLRPSTGRYSAKKSRSTSTYFCSVITPAECRPSTSAC